MRRLLAWIVVAFARLVTSLLSPARRAEVGVMVAADLGQATAEVHTARGRLILDTGTRPAFRRALNVQGAEPDTLAWLDALRDESCLWDIGANVGVYSLYAALSPNRRVVAFEPAAGTFALLVRNIELNRMSDRIAAYCAALSQETKLDALNMRTTEPGSWMNGFGVETNQFGEAIDIAFRQPAMGFAIDDFVRIFTPPLPSHVKMDVDGIEAMILRGGRNTLSAPTVRSMIVEIEGDPGSERNREILALMAELGFEARPRASPEFRNTIFDRKS